MKKLLLRVMVVCALMGAPAGYAMNTFNSMVSAASAWSPTVKISAAIVAGISGYTACNYLYKMYKNYLDNKVINETVDALYLSITLNSTIEKLPHNEREQAFRKKARCINIRKRVIAQLEDIIKQESLSKAHSIALQNRLKKFSGMLSFIDTMRTPNPYENEYSIPSMLDRIIENNLIKSIILNLKPENECTQEELAKKQELAHRRSIISEKLQEKILNNIVDKYGIYMSIAQLILS